MTINSLNNMKASGRGASDRTKLHSANLLLPRNRSTADKKTPTMNVAAAIINIVVAQAMGLTPVPDGTGAKDITVNTAVSTLMTNIRGGLTEAVSAVLIASILPAL
jgi:hypothetical protein